MNDTIKKQRGTLIVLSGPSGVGKSTVIAELLSERKDIYFSVSYTTRSPRPGEVDGVDYHFVDRAEFERMIAITNCWNTPNMWETITVLLGGSFGSIWIEGRMCCWTSRCRARPR